MTEDQPGATGTGGVDVQSLVASLMSGYGAGGGDSVLRDKVNVGPKPNQAYGAAANAYLAKWPTSGVRDRTTSLSDYNAEFFEKWNQPQFQTWLTSRMVAMGQRDTSTNSAYAFWVSMGEQTAKARGTQWTPEQYIEFMANGGLLKDLDAVNADMEAGNPLLDENGEPMVNPVQTQVNTMTADLNPLAANTAIDQMSMSLLGRAATKSEKKRLRGVINGILRSNPTTTTTTTDATDPNNVQVTQTTDAGMSAAEAIDAAEMNLFHSSEGQAFNAGKLLEEAMRGL